MSHTPETCPNCGADVPTGAKACSECGSDERTGWAADAYAGSLSLPDEDFDYKDFCKREFDETKPVKPEGVRWIWWVVAVVVLIACFLGWVL